MGFRSIYWGILFLFDFRIQHIDVLPDIIGYLLIADGISKLISYNKHFAEAKKYTLPLIFLALFDIYEMQIPIEEYHVEPMALFFMLLGLMTLYLDLRLFFHICNGIAENAQEHGNLELKELAMRRWNNYLYFKILMFIALPLALIIPSLIILIFIPLLAISIYVYISMMITGSEYGRPKTAALLSWGTAAPWGGKFCLVD